jgi:hypothetical protein
VVQRLRERPLLWFFNPLKSGVPNVWAIKSTPQHADAQYFLGPIRNFMGAARL